jgi:hypothetical protein
VIRTLYIPAFRAALAVVFVAAATTLTFAQTSDDDAALDLAQPDFSVVNLPTTLRLPAQKSDFHLTHRFGGNLRQGSFGDQADNLFGLDQGATIGLELRYGLIPHVQAVVHRSSFDKTIQLSAKWDPIRQNDSIPVSLSGVASIEAPNNFRERSNGLTVTRQVAPAFAAVISREVQDRLAVYATPVFVNNSAAAVAANRNTFYIGLAGRARISSTVYLVVEASPRVSGYAPGQTEYGFGIEKRAGAHVFQLTFANTIGTTLGQIARGGAPETLYLGFNLTRKFF